MSNAFRPATAVEILEKRKEANTKKIDSCYNEIVAISIKQHELANQHKKFADTQNELAKENDLLDRLLQEIKYPYSVFNTDVLSLSTEQIKPLTTVDLKTLGCDAKNQTNGLQEALDKLAKQYPVQPIKNTDPLNKDPWMINNDWPTKLCADVLTDWQVPK